MSSKRKAYLSALRGKDWLVVINNPTQSDDENLGKARQKGWEVVGNLEEGKKCKTPHYQLYIKSTTQQRGTAIDKLFPRAHIQLCRDPEAVKEYSTKEDTKIGDLPESLNLYPSCGKLMSWFGEAFDSYKPLGDGIRDDEFLTIFDKMIHQKIREGFYVEGMAVNPQIRSSIKNYGRSIAFRERLHRQKTDRQTDENIMSPSIIQHAVLPQVQEDETNETASQTSETSTSTGDE